MNGFRLFQNGREKDFEKFVSMISKLQPVEFDGLARILGVKCSTSEKNEDGEIEVTVRAFDKVMEEVFDSFLGLSKKKRKEVLEVVKYASKGAK